ncbi:MAG: GTP cyclohydrolase I FolE2 [Bacterioplanes sp.]|nr:GTP cyclohydrolase I FolE2 [Bacterioplanes sp.]
MTPNKVLPDISTSTTSLLQQPLQWVGMEGIDIPLRLTTDTAIISAKTDAVVDLPRGDIKGIHMSRLYRIVAELHQQPLTPQTLHMALQDMLISHQSCASQHAKITLRFSLLQQRPALVTSDLSGWNSYPITLTAVLQRDVMSLNMEVDVAYSSTCPCSASLARQLIAQHFIDTHSDSTDLTVTYISDWLQEHATFATPHSQRSIARIRATLPIDHDVLPLLTLIDQAENALATPVQTAVKRADEQAFAKLNGQNLMFVEDAARRLINELQDHYADVHVQVQHLESLHPHNAVASAVSTHS